MKTFIFVIGVFATSLGYSQSNDRQCQEALEMFPSYPESEAIYGSSVAPHPDFGCYVLLDFFGVLPLYEFVNARVEAGHQPDVARTGIDDGNVAVRLFLTQPKTAYPMVLDENDRILPDDQTPEECAETMSQLASEIAATDIGATVSVRYGAHGGFWGTGGHNFCYVEIDFDSAESLERYVLWRVEENRYLSFDVKLRTFSNGDLGPYIQVPIWLSTGQ